MRSSHKTEVAWGPSQTLTGLGKAIDLVGSLAMGELVRDLWGAWAQPSLRPLF